MSTRGPPYIYKKAPRAKSGLGAWVAVGYGWTLHAASDPETSRG